MERLIIGIVGSFGSGCSTVSDILNKKKGFIHIKVSDIIRDFIIREEKKFDKLPKKEKRTKLQNYGNKLRKTNGTGYLANIAIEQATKINNKRPIIIDCIKNPGEVEAIRKHSKGYVIAVNAPFSVRWERCQNDYDGDQKQFKMDDERDRKEKNQNGDILKEGQEVQKCVDLADIYINNDKQFLTKREKEEFIKKILYYIYILENPGSREPTIGELMMNNAYCTSLLSKCLKRRVGAIITLPQSSTEECIISSGYNTIPKGQRSCREEHGKCYREICIKAFEHDNKIKIENVPGRLLDRCRSLHAEENAILQMCRIGGTPLVGATLYTTTFPCSLCAKKIVTAGLSRVVWQEPYPDIESKKILESAEIGLIEFEGIKSNSFYKLFYKA